MALFFIDRRRLRKQIDAPLLNRLRPDRRKVMPHIKFALCMMALAFFILAAANPRTPGKEISATRSGVDVLFCLDVSKSMDAQDVKPNRLEACKMAINHCIDKMNGNRVGAVVFAGTAEVALPAISNPKPNGYQALHTTVMSKSGKWIEVQIRSHRMDEIAERGMINFTTPSPLPSTFRLITIMCA